jgi:hypothetical protein
VAVARLQGGAAETVCLEGRAARWRDAGGQGNAARGAARRDTTRRGRAGQRRWRGAQVDVGGRGGAQGGAAALEGDRRAVDGGDAEGRR